VADDLGISFVRPSLSELLSQMRADFLARMGADEFLRRSDIEVQARVQAAAWHTVLGFIEHLALQILPYSATDWLDRHAQTWGILRRQPTKSAGVVVFSASGSLTVPAGVTMKTSDGIEFVSSSESVAASGSVSVPVIASVVGLGGNIAAATPVYLLSPIAGMASAGAAGDDFGGGADIEDDETLRQRLTRRIQQPPHGGAKFDYTDSWAGSQSFVARSWCFPLQGGPGTVGLTFIVKRDNPIPTTDDVTQLQDFIDGQRPATAEVIVFAPVALPIDLEIAVDPDTTAVRLSIEAALKDFLLRVGEPGGLIYYSTLREAISLAAGETRHRLIAPAHDADIAVLTSQFPVLGSITWSVY
jgi:uncharacterized phage protein gp47/JayE